MTKRLLDLGAGAGGFANYLYLKNPGSEVFGVDISEDNIKRCEENRVSEKQVFKVAQGEKLPFQEAFFDEVHSYEVLEHVIDFDQSLGEIKRVLKRGGILSLSVPIEKSEMILKGYYPEYFEKVGHRRTFTKESLIKQLTEKGFTVEKYVQCNAAEHLFIGYLFKSGWNIINQLGESNRPPPMVPFYLMMLASRDLVFEKFYTKNFVYKIGLVLLSPIWILGRILDCFLQNKRQKVVCRTT